MTDIQAYASQRLASMPETVTRLQQPDTYPVTLSPALAAAKAEVIQAMQHQHLEN